MNKKQICKVVVLLLLLGISISYVSGVLIKKWKYPCYESVVPTEFYELDKNSIEVCVLGTSQVVYGISGMELYGDYGISAYSLGTALQPMEASYAWLQECRRTQDIKLLLLDTSMLYEQADEARYRQAYDNMKLSVNKLKAVWEHCQNKENADPFISYVLPIIKYHTRWNELVEDDFTLLDQDTPIFRGNYAFALSDPVDMNAIAYDNDTYDETLTMQEEQFGYFEKILDYCEENGIEVLLFKTPKANWSITKHQQVEEYASGRGIPFIDFSNQEMIDTLQLDGELDFRDKEHLNLRGANKLSKWLGAYLKEHYELTDYREVEGFDDLDYSRYCERVEDIDVQLCMDPVDYFSHLDNERYEVLMQLSTPAEEFVTAELAEAVQAAGISTDLTQIGRQSFVGWLKQGESRYEAVSEEDLDFEDKLSDKTGFHLFSKLASGSNSTMIRLNYKSKYFSSPGLNVMVFDTENQTLVDMSTIYLDQESQTLKLIKDNNSYTS
jgi:hypothetical protein